ncbi:hypothetical protein LTR17_004736 [Elasticomyces elasticus]|nr:hypothetical protein LTR17_004736 [Elasticomyces elasticus]
MPKSQHPAQELHTNGSLAIQLSQEILTVAPQAILHYFGDALVTPVFPRYASTLAHIVIEGMAAELHWRLHAALGQLLTERDLWEAHASKSVLKFEPFQVPAKQYRWLKSLYDKALETTGEVDEGMRAKLCAMEQTFKYEKQRYDAVQRHVTRDRLAFKARMEQIAQRLVDSDENHPGLETILTPYASSKLEDTTAGSFKPKQVSAEEFTLNGARVYGSLPWCPTIVLTNDDNKWVEICCPVCGGNASDTGELMLGLEAMHNHLTVGHSCKPMSMSQVVELCKMRTVKISAVRNICAQGDAGAPYIDVVVAKSDIASKASEENLRSLSMKWSHVGWGWSKHPENFIAAIPCIVRHPAGGWYVLQCPICRGNASACGTKGFFSGPNAFHDHIRKDHEKVIIGTVAATIAICQVHELTSEEVKELRAGSRSALVIEPVPVKATVYKTDNPSPKKFTVADFTEDIGMDMHGKEGRKAFERARKRSLERDDSYGMVSMVPARNSSHTEARAAPRRLMASPEHRLQPNEGSAKPNSRVVASSSRDTGHPRSAKSDNRAGHDDESTVRFAKKRKVNAVELGDMVHTDEATEHLGGAISVRRGSLTNEPAMPRPQDQEGDTFENAQVISDGEESEHLSDAEFAHSADHADRSALPDPNSRKSISPSMFVSENEGEEVKEGQKEEEDEEEAGGAVLPQQAVPRVRHTFLGYESSDEE